MADTDDKKTWQITVRTTESLGARLKHRARKQRWDVGPTVEFLCELAMDELDRQEYKRPLRTSTYPKASPNAAALNETAPRRKK